MVCSQLCHKPLLLLEAGLKLGSYPQTSRDLELVCLQAFVGIFLFGNEP